MVAQSKEANEASATVSGSYSQWLYGTRAEYLVSEQTRIGISAVKVADDENSINTPLTYVESEKSTVMGADAKFGISKKVAVTGEFAASLNAKHTTFQGTKNDKSFTIGLEMAPVSSIGMNLKYQKMGPNFVSLSAPSTYRDRVGYYTSANWKPSKYLGFKGGFNIYRDNLENKDVLITETSEISYGAEVNPVSWLSVYGRMSDLKNIGDDESLMNNETFSPSFGATAILGNKFNLSIDYSISQFKDKTRVSPETNTNTLGLNSAYQL